MYIPYLGFRFPVFNIFFSVQWQLRKPVRMIGVGCQEMQTVTCILTQCTVGSWLQADGKSGCTDSGWRSAEWCRSQKYGRAQERLSLMQTNPERTGCVPNCIPWPVGILPAQEKTALRPSEVLQPQRISPCCTKITFCVQLSLDHLQLPLLIGLASSLIREKLLYKFKIHQRYYPGLDRPTLLQGPLAVSS